MRRTTFGAIQLAIAALCVISLVSRYRWGLGSATFTPGNYFAYLTIQSNLLFVAVTVVAAAVTFRDRPPPRWLDTARAAVLTGTVTSGLVFALIIEQSGAQGFRIDVPWSDRVLHFVLPVLALLDWIIIPGRGRARWRTVGFVYVFVAGWTAVTLLRGPVVRWYPYFFLDPAQLDGAGEFVLFAAIAIALFGGVACGIVAISRTRPVADRVSESRARRIRRGPTARDRADRRR